MDSILSLAPPPLSSPPQGEGNAPRPAVPACCVRSGVPLILKIVFSIIRLVEGSAVGVETPRWYRAMTRCECAGVPFAEVAQRMREEGLSFDQVAERTGCGRLCTACLPDLRDHVSRAR